MTHFSDPLRQGRSVFINGGGVSGATADTLGVPTSPLAMYDILPLTAQLNNLATNQTVSNASWTLSAGTGITATTIAGETVYDLGCERCISYSGTATGTTAVLINARGYDTYGVPLTITTTGPSGTAITTTTKPLRYLAAVSTTSNTTSGVTVGTSDTIGFLQRVDAFGYVVINYASAVITSSAGFTAAVTTTASATTGGVRGTYALPSASDGVKRLTTLIYAKDPDTKAGAFGVDQA